MAEIILPPEENEETPETPELNIDKPTENSKVITIEFEAKKTNKVSTKDTNQQLYTTDTDAWFEFKETSLESANGTYSVVFRNRHDGSIFQRTGDVVGGVAYYKIPHQEIRHAGAWRGQIVYTLSNGDTTSREFGYDVKGHILDGKDVREIVVEDFETLMSQLRSMKDNAEVELANLTQELRNATDTAEQNETDRQVFFDDLVEDIDELQANYQELLDTGVLQTNINTKLEALEEEYAPKLTDVTAQLAQTTEDIFHGQLTNKIAMKPSLTIIDDDGRPKVYTHLKLLAEEYNIPITSAVITGRIGVDDSVHISKEQMQELEKVGFEFVSHTKNHPHLATLTEAEIEVELKESSEWLNENGFDGHSTIVYPFGSYNASVLRIARKYYKSGFDIPVNGGSYVKPILNQFAISRIAYNSMDGTYDTANIKSAIDESLINNGWTIAMSHAGYNNFTIAGLREIVEYANSKGVEIITVKEGLNRFGNLVDISGSSGIATVGANGQLSAGFRNWVGPSHIKLGTPITDYPTGLSLTYVNNAHEALTDFPLREGGSLETFNPAHLAYAYQKYITFTDKDVYFRSWNTTRNEWEAWEKQSNAHTKQATASTAFTEFKVGFTISYMNTDNASGLPDNTAGTLVTYKPSTLPATCYQTFKKYNSTGMYIRHLNSSSNWTNWVNTNRPHENARTVDTTNGWTTSVSFSKTQDGQVWLRGRLSAGTVTAGTVIATLPYGYSGGYFYPYFSVHNHTQNKPITDAIQIFGRDLVLKSSEIVTGDSVRFSTYFQTIEN